MAIQIHTDWHLLLLHYLAGHMTPVIMILMKDIEELAINLNLKAENSLTQGSTLVLEWKLLLLAKKSLNLRRKIND